MAKMELKSILVSLIACIEIVSCARILGVFPVPSISHQVVYRALTTELAKRGHQVTVITTDPVNDPASEGILKENYRQIDVHEMSYDMWHRLFNCTEIAGAHQKNSLWMFKNVSNQLLDAQLRTPQVQQIIKNDTEQFDLLLLESLVRSNFAFSWRFKAPVIGFSSLSGIHSNFVATGSPMHPVLYPDVGLNNADRSTLSIWNKINMIYNDMSIRNVENMFLDAENSLGRKHFGEDMPPIDVLETNMDMLFLNVNPMLAGIRPVVPATLYLGGLHLKEKKNLPKELQKFLDESPQGVVYMSLGTNVMSKDLPPKVLMMMLEVFGALPYRVLWKFEEELTELRLPSNVRISKWLPQADLLGHPNIKAFITQGGLQSMDEAIRDHVPLIGIPFLGDQNINTQKFITHGIGVRLDINTFNKEDFKTAIMNVTTDPKYKENIKRLSQLLSDQPMSSLERAVWWTEYVLRHRGAAHLRAPSAGLSLREFLMLDVVAALAAAAAVAALLLDRLVRGVCRKLYSEQGKLKKN